MAGGIEVKTPEQILVMRRAGLVVASRGSGGGVRLARPAAAMLALSLGLGMVAVFTSWETTENSGLFHAALLWTVAIIAAVRLTRLPHAATSSELLRRTNSAPHMRTSRLRETRPVTMRCRLGSMKSGPHLKGCTRTPRRASAAITARVTVVLPQPEWVPAMSSPGWAFTGR